jgi:hypothetical protein
MSPNPDQKKKPERGFCSTSRQAAKTRTAARKMEENPHKHPSSQEKEGNYVSCWRLPSGKTELRDSGRPSWGLGTGWALGWFVPLTQVGNKGLGMGGSSS